jgi:hypothetical protein
MGKVREPQIILKTDQGTVLLEIAWGEFEAKSNGWDEKRVFLEGDVLEIAVRNGRRVLPCPGRAAPGSGAGRALFSDRG